MARVQTVVVNRTVDFCNGTDGGGISEEQYNKILELINRKADIDHNHAEYAMVKDVFLKEDSITNREIDSIISIL